MSPKSTSKSMEPTSQKTALSLNTKSYLEKLAAAGKPPLNTYPAAEARRLYRANSAAVVPIPMAVESIQDLQLESVHGPFQLRLYRPIGSKSTSALPVLLYIHGGGWTVGDIETHDSLCRQFANQAQCAVASIDYHLAPEFPFPAAVDDCLLATSWIAENAKAFALDASRIGVGGDSAGGNLAAVVALHSVLNDGPPIQFQLLLYPATDHHMVAPSHLENGQGYFLSTELAVYFRDHYVGPENYDDWRASPAKAPRFNGVAPALIITAGFDPFRDEGFEYAELLRSAGVEVTYSCYPDMIHGFMRLGKVIPEAQLAIDEAAQALAKRFGTPFLKYPNETESPK